MCCGRTSVVRPSTWLRLVDLCLKRWYSSIGMFQMNLLHPNSTRLEQILILILEDDIQVSKCFRWIWTFRRLRKICIFGDGIQVLEQTLQDLGKFELHLGGGIQALEQTLQDLGTFGIHYCGGIQVLEQTLQDLGKFGLHCGGGIQVLDQTLQDLRKFGLYLQEWFLCFGMT